MQGENRKLISHSWRRQIRSLNIVVVFMTADGSVEP